MAEKWEHMALKAECRGTQQQLTELTPDGQERPLSADRASTRQILRELDGLGDDGWQLVTVETSVQGAAEFRTYWLKRRLNSEPDAVPHVASGG